MPNSLRKIGAISLFVSDLATARAFYHAVFEAATIYEDAESAVMGFDNVMINLLKISEAPALIGPAKVATQVDGVRCQFSIFVDNVDDVCSRLEGLGITLLTQPQNREWGKRTATFEDPDGHNWEVAHDL